MHKCKCECEHKEVKYCSKCKIVTCSGCGQVWELPTNYVPSYPYYPYFYTDPCGTFYPDWTIPDTICNTTTIIPGQNT